MIHTITRTINTPKSILTAINQKAYFRLNFGLCAISNYTSNILIWLRLDEARTRGAHMDILFACLRLLSPVHRESSELVCREQDRIQPGSQPMIVDLSVISTECYSGSRVPSSIVSNTLSGISNQMPHPN